MAKNGMRYNDKNLILVSMCLYMYVVLHIFFYQYSYSVCLQTFSNIQQVCIVDCNDLRFCF